MAGTATPRIITEYVAKASPVLPLTLTDDSGLAVNLTSATLSGYILDQQTQTIAKMYGTFTIQNQSTNLGQATYQWTLIDVSAPGVYSVYVSAKLPSEPYQREFNPIILLVLATAEYIGGIYVQEVDININQQPPSNTNSLPVDVIDRSGRVLGTVIITSMPSVTVGSMPAITGTVTPQVGGSNVSASNPLPTTMGQQGPLTQWNGNPGTTNANAETLIKFGSSGTTTFQRIVIDNQSGGTIWYTLDETITVNNGVRILSSAPLYLFQPGSVLHLWTTSAISINTSGGIVIKAYN